MNQYKDNCPDWPNSIIAALTPNAWKFANTDFNPEKITLDLSIARSWIDERIHKAFAPKKVKSVFYSAHLNGNPTEGKGGFQNVIVPGYIPPSPSACDSGKQLQRNISNTYSKYNKKASGRTPNSNVFGFIISILLGYVFYQYDHNSKVEQTLLAEQKKNANLNGQIKEKDRQIKDKDGEISRQGDQLEQEKRYADAWRQINEALRPDAMVNGKLDPQFVIGAVKMRLDERNKNSDKSKLTDVNEILRELVKAAKTLLGNQTEVTITTGDIESITRFKLNAIGSQEIKNFKRELDKAESLIK